MRIRMLVAVIATVVSSSAFVHAAATSSVAPCTTATATCERWVSLSGGPARSMVYATYPLDVRNTAITRALIMVHGADRNADHYFETANAGGFLAGALKNTIIIAPRFAAGKDKVESNEILWPSHGDSWRSGGQSPANPALSSFDLADELLRELANKKIFPNLTHIVVAGHSAGGQFATRYAMANKVDGTLNGVTVSYVVANPSSYAWPASVRPLPVGDGDPAFADKEALGDSGESVHSNFSYGPFDSAKAPDFDRWPAGLEARKGYTAAMSDEQLKKQLASRSTTYLLGQVDVLPLGGFDSSPSGMAQGPTRRARGEAFFKFITDSLGAKHKAIIVPECGHNDRCIYTSEVVLPVIFPN
jgi:pimeloyl-ACP methyl ester carboxylesterase